MKSGTRHLIGAGAGIAAAGAVSLLLFAGEYKAFGTQSWAAGQAPGSLARTSMALTPVSSAAAAVLLAGAALVAGLLCGSRRLSPVAPLAAGLPLFAFGLLCWLDTYRVTLLFGGSLSLSWSRLVTDQVFLVVGAMLLASAAVPSRWLPALLAGPRSSRWTGVAAALGVVAIPVVWYLVQLTNLTAADYLDTYWWPFHQTARYAVDLLFVLVIATLSVLVASRRLRVTAVVAGAPMLAMGVLGLLAPGLAKDLIAGVGLSPAWRYAVLLDVTSGLPLLYGGILVASGLTPMRRPRRARVPAKVKPASAAAAS